jgi:uncharacterized protein (DUF1330 family)
MKHITAGAALVAAAIVAGGSGISVPQAQPAAKEAFVVAETHVVSPFGYTDYIKQEPATLKPFHGRVVARALPDVREGPIADGTVTIYAFPSVEAANDWYNSAEYAKLRVLREQSAQTRLYFLSGIVQQP